MDGSNGSRRLSDPDVQQMVVEEQCAEQQNYDDDDDDCYNPMMESGVDQDLIRLEREQNAEPVPTLIDAVLTSTKERIKKVTQLYMIAEDTSESRRTPTPTPSSDESPDDQE